MCRCWRSGRTRAATSLRNSTFAEAHATIRTALVSNGDPGAAAQSDLVRTFGMQLGEAIYQDKVNLADGTWTVLLYEPDGGYQRIGHGAA